MDATAFSLISIFMGGLLLFVSTIRCNASSVDGGLFFRISAFDNRKVTSDADAVHIVRRELTSCASSCNMQKWCSSFFYTSSSGACSLHATVFMTSTSAQQDPGTRYYTFRVDWCPTDLLYNRPAEMCVYFEQDPALFRMAWQPADQACISRGMRLAQNITPLKMDALWNITKKNSDSFHESVYIGLKRSAPGSTTFSWIDGQPLNTTALAPYWEAYQPNGQSTGQDCVVIRASVDSTLNDVQCITSSKFVCELSSPDP